MNLDYNKDKQIYTRTMVFYLDYDMSYADDLDDDWSYDLDEQYSHSHVHLDYAELAYRHYA